MSRMIRRQQATQAAVDRFQGKPFEWGRYDCVRLAAFMLREMGHRPGLGRAGSYKTAKGAVGALRRAGYATLAEAMDGLGLQRIPPAAALPGDIVMVPSDGAWSGSLMVAVGNGRTIGWAEGLEAADVFQPVAFVAAWRA
ncbi:DUF6950 family protein [Sphingomonas sp. Leaf4]|uniref:DUF6950 family protein n=1 Tax=Sphingomonas sp. Leaf4 TaxID=2876553 RepID=UPI001E4A305A|nr:hypothetical protein [Sphingomonas sp. Leaf4]